MITPADVEKFAHEALGYKDAGRRIHDRGFAFTVSTQPARFLDGNRSAMTIGNGPTYVIKETGAVYPTSSMPAQLQLQSATTRGEWAAGLLAAGIRAPRSIATLSSVDGNTQWTFTPEYLANQAKWAARLAAYEAQQ